MVSKNFRQRKTILGFLLVLVIALLTWQFTRYRPGGRVQEGDYLIYRTENSPLTLYDPFTNKHRPILEGWSVGGNFALTPGRLAFSSDDNIYLLDYPFTNTPQPITSEGFGTAYLDSWSTDGRYLAYKTVYQDMITLWLWDNREKRTTPIYYHPTGYYLGKLSWGPQGQLAFNLSHGFNSADGKINLEVFIWDGQNVLNLSQNPAGDDTEPVWNQNGQLAFLSEIEEAHYQIFIWDGVSKVNGIPDKNSFTHIITPTTELYHNTVLHWNYQNLLFFISPLTPQIYQWDGKVVAPINNTANTYYANWYKDGYWFMSSAYSDRDNLHIRNSFNQTMFTDKRLHNSNPVWSEYGLLAYCTNSEVRGFLKKGNLDYFFSELWSGTPLDIAYSQTFKKMPTVFHLFMWSGDTTTVKIVDGTLIMAYWSNGQSIDCANGFTGHVGG